MDNLITNTMSISSITAGLNTAANSAVAERSSGTVGKDGFLQLLVTQLRYQDPVNPMDGAQFATQLSQFNSLEQLINLNASFENMAIAQQIMSNDMNNALAASITGKSVSAMSDKIVIGGTSDGQIHLRLSQPATEAEIIIRDRDGDVVRRITTNNLSTGDQSIPWDQKDDNGNRLSNGTYSVEVKAKNGDNPIQALTFLKGIAERIRYSSQGVMVMINGVSVPLSYVEEVGVGD
jgi:flagellar basal-body rod modification protein FlgD